ncbi:MAG: helix-turn-helix transcriptional regulator [Opitutales bacterium]
MKPAASPRGRRAQDVTRDAIRRQLKDRGPQTADALADRVGVSAVAVRQHLQAMKRRGEATATPGPSRRGRPALEWHLQGNPAGTFADGHRELALSFLAIAGSGSGKTLKRLIKGWVRQEVKAGRKAVKGKGGPMDRLDRLVAWRRELGCRPRLETLDTLGAFQLREAHCPWLAAMTACPELREAEHQILARLTAPAFTIKPVTHLANDDPQTVYLLAPGG